MTVVETDTIHLIANKLIGKGNEYNVFSGLITSDGIHRVVKVPARRWYNRKLTLTRETAEQDLRIVSSYFGSYLADTTFSGQTTDFVVLQEEVQRPTTIRKRHLKDKAMREELKHILAINGHMKRETGKSLGILGRGGALSLLSFRPQITNLLIEQGETPRVRITDFGLLDKNRLKDRLSLAGNAVVLALCFGLTPTGKEITFPFARRHNKR